MSAPRTLGDLLSQWRIEHARGCRTINGAYVCTCGLAEALEIAGGVELCEVCHVVPTEGREVRCPDCERLTETCTECEGPCAPGPVWICDPCVAESERIHDLYGGANG